MENTNEHDDSREFLFFAGGLAFMVLGAGLIASHPAVRKAEAKGCRIRSSGFAEKPRGYRQREQYGRRHPALHAPAGDVI
jgi:hypothetical protein